MNKHEGKNTTICRYLVRSIQQASSCLSLEEGTVHAGRKVLMEVDYILIIVW
jgi:hypothetical protein